MKIIKLRFKNLNSLQGEWSIDFTSPQYVSDGIFAITGPTGAGKSTILDAICLALYGRTPRLKQISKSSNEIMSRQTGECFSEVIFETKEGRFKCHWSQAKARKKTGGNLLDSKHEISDDDSGNIIESKKRDVAKAIEERTGMDFDRFTRSILLAQGGFAAFLQASPDDRAPILEDITGTEIYTEISKKVHERQRLEKEKIELLRAETSGIQIIDQDEEARLLSELADKQNTETTISAQSKQTSDAIIWHKSVMTLEEEVSALEKAALEVSSELESFKDSREKLSKAFIAAELDSEHLPIVSLRQQQKNDLEALSFSEKLIPEKEKILATQSEELEKKEEILSGLKENQKNESEIIKNIRSLDLQIKENEKRLNSVSSEIKTIQDQITANNKKKKTSEEKFSSAQDDLVRADKYIFDNSCDSELVAEFTGIKEKTENLKAALAKQIALNSDLKKTKKQLENACSALKLQENEFEIKKTAFETSQTDSKKISGAIIDLLQGRNLKQLRNENETLKEKLRIMDAISNLFESITSDKKNLSDSETTKAALNQKITETLSEIISLSEKKEIQEREILLLEEKISLLNKIKDLEEERLKLEDGKPCPLCGSQDHPFAKGNIPKSDETENELSNAKSLLKKTDSTLSALNVKKAGFEKDLEHSEKKARDLGVSIERNKEKIFDQLQKIGINESENVSEEIIKKEQNQTKESISSFSEVIEKAEKLEDELKAAEIREKTAEKSYSEAEKSLDKARNKKKESESDAERTEKDIAQAGQTCTELRENLLSKTSGYGINEISGSELGAIAGILEKRLLSWQSNQNQKTETEKLINELSNELKGLDSQLKVYDENLRSRHKSYGEIEADLHELRTDRKEIYGEKDPDQEERRIGLLVAGSETDLEKARQARDEAGKNLNELMTRTISLKENIEKRNNEIDRLDAAFMASLEKSCFDNESDFLESRLPKEDRDNLSRTAKNLDTRQAEILARQKDRTDRLDQELNKKTTEKSLDELSAEQTLFEESLKTLVQDMGAIKQRLADNESARLKFKEKLVLIEKQKTECSRWDELHDLIGSADGKKFRNFAQGLTFEIMVSHANRQLGKMTDRYLLIRDDIQPLELNVVDNYQAGEIRSTKNLSGGESFIVSLSLALGLSHMASRKVRVDSLFLDEGFGTLDEEALETALETLSSLQQDGKLIGVISHVSALKERISTRINVQPISGGKSIISGPGCVHIK